MTEHIRTCRGCRRKDSRDILLRFVLSTDTQKLLFDKNKKLSGRGYWVHNEKNCIERAKKLANVKRALRTQNHVDCSVLSEFTWCDSQ